MRLTGATRPVGASARAGGLTRRVTVREDLEMDDEQRVIPPPGPYPGRKPELKLKLLNDPIARYTEPVTCLKCKRTEWFCFCDEEESN